MSEAAASFKPAMSGFLIAGAASEAIAYIKGRFLTFESHSKHKNKWAVGFHVACDSYEEATHKNGLKQSNGSSHCL